MARFMAQRCMGELTRAGWCSNCAKMEQAIACCGRCRNTVCLLGHCGKVHSACSMALLKMGDQDAAARCFPSMKTELLRGWPRRLGVRRMMFVIRLAPWHKT